MHWDWLVRLPAMDSSNGMTSRRWAYGISQQSSCQVHLKFNSPRHCQIVAISPALKATPGLYYQGVGKGGGGTLKLGSRSLLRQCQLRNCRPVLQTRRLISLKCWRGRGGVMHTPTLAAGPRLCGWSEPVR